MKKIAGIILAAVIAVFLLSSCMKNEVAFTRVTEETKENSSADENRETIKPADLANEVRERLSETYSFEMKTRYVDLGVQGFEQTITETFAQNKTFDFSVFRRNWWHFPESEQTENTSFYYRFEEGRMVCYIRNEDGAERIVMTNVQRKELEGSRMKLEGPSAVFPPEAANLTEVPSEKAGEKQFRFDLTLGDCMKEETYLQAFLKNVFSMCDHVQPDPSLIVVGTLTVGEDCRPVSLSYDFSALEPYVLSIVVYAEQPVGALTFEYSFDFDLAKTLPLPDDIARAAQK